jgi:hypothetical protein
MNKQELIEEINEIATETPFPNAKIVDHSEVIELIKRLDEPQKVTVPQFVADYIKDAKYYEWDLDDAFDHIAEESEESEIYEWFYTLGNIDVFARAWLDGYTVEKEKRYIVKMKGMNKSSTILKLDEITGSWYLGEDAEYSYTKTAHTRKELEEAGFGEVFNSPLFEVEEVEGEM